MEIIDGDDRRSWEMESRKKFFISFNLENNLSDVTTTR